MEKYKGLKSVLQILTNAIERGAKNIKRTPVESVMFVPLTKNGEVARQLKKNEETLFNLTGTGISS